MDELILLFATPVFAFSFPVIYGQYFYLPSLFIVFSAYLAKRFGLTGVISVSLGGVVFLLEHSFFAASPQTYFIALAVALLVLTSKDHDAPIAWPQKNTSAGWLYFFAPLLSMVTISIINGQDGSFQFGFSMIGAFLLFILGCRGVALLPFVLGLADAVLMSWALSHTGGAENVLRGISEVAITFRQMGPLDFLGMVLAVSAGAAMQAMLSGRPQQGIWRQPYGAAIALGAVWTIPPLLRGLQGDLAILDHWGGDHVAYLLPMAAFMIGLFKGARGTICAAAVMTAISLAIFVTMMTGPGFLSDYGYALSYDHSAPLQAALYAAFGARVSEHRLGKVSYRAALWPISILIVVLLNAFAVLILIKQGVAQHKDVIIGYGIIDAIMVVIGFVRHYLIRKGIDLKLRMIPRYVIGAGVALWILREFSENAASFIENVEKYKKILKIIYDTGEVKNIVDAILSNILTARFIFVVTLVTSAAVALLFAFVEEVMRSYLKLKSLLRYLVRWWRDVLLPTLRARLTIILRHDRRV